MGQTIAIARNFDAGFISDVSRDELPQNAAFRMVDFIPQLEAPLRGRGGWAYGSPDLGSLGGTAASVASLGFLPFAADGHLVVVSNAGSVYQIKQFDGGGGALVTDTGDTAIVPTWPVFWHKWGSNAGYGIILGGLNQTAHKPKKYQSGYNCAQLGTSATDGTGVPQARFGFSKGDYLVLGNYYDLGDSGNLHNNRVAFSAVANPEAWQTTGATASTIDFPEEMIAGIPLVNGDLYWGYNNCHIITGSTPPPGGDMARRVLFAGNGTFDGRSCVPWRDYAIWANAAGIWKSDGATLTDLTAAAGISVYWRQQVSGFAFVNGWRAHAGIYRDHYVITILNAAGALVKTFVIDLSRNVATTWSNIPAALFASRSAGPGTALFGGDEELFFAHKSSPRVGKISTLWTPSITYAADADASAVLPVLETPFYTIGGQGPKRIRRVYVSYEMLTGGGAPTIAVSYTTNPDVGSAYTPQLPALPLNTKMKRVAVDVRQAGLGVALKLALTAASANLGIYGLELEAHPQEQTR